MIWHFLTFGDVWNLFDHLWTFLVHWKLAQKFSTHFIKSFKNVVPSTHAKTWLYFPLFFQTRSAKFPGYKESQLIKQQILRLFGSLPFGQLRVLVVTKGQKISKDPFLVFLFLSSNNPKNKRIVLQIAALASKKWSIQKKCKYSITLITHIDKGVHFSLFGPFLQDRTEIC